MVSTYQSFLLGTTAGLIGGALLWSEIGREAAKTAGVLAKRKGGAAVRRGAGEVKRKLRRARE